MSSKGVWLCRLGLAVLLLDSVPLWAQAADAPSVEPSDAQRGERVSLEALLDEAQSRNPSLRAARERAEAAKRRVAQAWALPDPSVGYMLMGDMLETRLGPQEDVFEVEQMVPFPGKLWAQRKMAQAEADAAEASLQATMWEVTREVSVAYYDLYVTEGSIGAVEEILDRLKQFEQVAQTRYASAGGSQRDVAKAQAEVAMTLERLFLLQEQRQALGARMNALLDSQPQTTIGTLEPVSATTLEQRLEELLDMARTSRPELREAASMVKRDRHAKALAKQAYAPDLSVGFQYVRIGSGMTTDPDDGRDAWMVPIRVTLPLWQNRIVPALQEADRNLRASQAEFEGESNRTAYEVRAAYYRHTTAIKLVELYENALLPEGELAFRSDQAGYEGGKQDILNLLDSERVYLNAQVAYYQALGEALKSVVELERAVGSWLHHRVEGPEGAS